MEIGKFNEFMKKFVLLDEIPNGVPKEIGLLTIIESLMDKIDKKGKVEYRKEGILIIPPWLYDVEDSSIILNLGELKQEINVKEDLIELIKKRKPFIRIIKESGHFTLEIPKM